MEPLFQEVLIPEAVYKELTVNVDSQDEIEVIKRSSFIRVVSVKKKKAVDVLRRFSGLDLGESKAIVYADDSNADVLLIKEQDFQKDETV